MNDVPVWVATLLLVGAISWVLLLAWLVRLTMYDWDEFSMWAKFFAACGIVVLSLPLTFILIGMFGVCYGFSLFFCIRPVE